MSATATGPVALRDLIGGAAVGEPPIERRSPARPRETASVVPEVSPDEVECGVRMLRFYAGECWRLGGVTLPLMQPRTRLSTEREPLGVAGIITSWNFPIAIPVWKLAPALAAGKAVVLKPASLAPATTAVIADCLSDAGPPAGVLNVVYGSGSRAGEALTGDAGVEGISFTGSTDTGRHVNERAAARMARAQLDLGGNNAMAVLPDADLELAAELCAKSAYGPTGQACTATSRDGLLHPRQDCLRRIRVTPIGGIGWQHSR